MNTTQLNQMLSDEIAQLRSGKVKPDRVNAVVRAAATIISAARLELAYFKMVGGQRGLTFFGTETKQALVSKKK